MIDLERVPGGFKIGRTYKHTTGYTIRVVGSAFTHAYGYTLIAETSRGTLEPVGSEESNTVNFVEIQNRTVQS